MSVTHSAKYDYERLGALVDGYQIERFLRSDYLRACYVAIAGDGRRVELHFLHGLSSTQGISASIGKSLRDLSARLNRVALPGLVRVDAIGWEEPAIPYIAFDIALEPSACRDLAQLLKERQALSLSSTLELARFAAETLHPLHELGFVHGAMSSNCFLLDATNHKPIQLASFGLRQVAEAVRGERRISVGSPLYMSPEQCAGGPVDRRSDIYSLGAVLYECLSAAPPLAGGSAMEIVLRKKSTDVPSLRKQTRQAFPPELEEFLKKCLTRSPRERYADCSKLLADLTELQARLRPDLSGDATGDGSGRDAGGGATGDASRDRSSSRQSARTFKQPLSCPPIELAKLPRSYKILRSAAPSDLHNLQLIEAAELDEEQRRLDSRRQMLAIQYAGLLSVICALYLSIIWCLQSVPERRTRASTDLSSAPKVAQEAIHEGKKIGSRFLAHLPNLEKGELAGQTRLDSVMKFCSPYMLIADGCRGDFSKIAALTKLEYLSAADTRISDADMKDLGDLPLRTLDLSRCHRLGADGLRTIASMPYLRVLRLNGCHLTQHSLALLSPALWQLELDNCSLTDKNLEPLTKLKHLDSISLDGNKLTGASFKYFRQLKELRYLSVRGNPSIKLEEVQRLLKDMPHTVISIEPETQGVLHYYAHASLADCIKQSNGVVLRAPSTSGEFSQISRLKNLEILLLRSSNITPDQMAALQNLPLRYIDFDHCNVGRTGLRYLKQIPTLVWTKAEISSISDDCVDELNANLTDLTVYGCQITDAGVKKLSRLKSLRYLNIGYTLATPDCFETIRSLPHLRILDVHSCQSISIDQAKALEDSKPGLIVISNRTRY